MDYNTISITFTNMFLSLGLSFLFFILFSATIYYLQGKDIGEYPAILFGDMPLRQTIIAFFVLVIFTIFVFMAIVNRYDIKKEIIPKRKKEIRAP